MNIGMLLLLLLLSRFSRVRLCATPEMAAHQALLSLGFSRQEHRSGLPFPSPMHESEKWKWSCSVLFDFAIPWTAAYQAPPSMGFFQARILEWGAIAFSGTLGCMCLFELCIFLGISPVMGSLGHMIVLFLIFKGTSILFSIVAAPNYIPTNSIGEFPFLHTLSSIYYL